MIPDPIRPIAEKDPPIAIAGFGVGPLLEPHAGQNPLGFGEIGVKFQGLLQVLLYLPLQCSVVRVRSQCCLDGLHRFAVGLDGLLVFAVQPARLR